MMGNIGYEKRLQALERKAREISGGVPQYAVGTWTPAFAGTGTAGTFTYVAQVGRYERIGQLCITYGLVSISAISVAPTTNMTITGLPFTAVNVTNLRGWVYFGLIDNFNYSANAIELTGQIVENTTVIALNESFDNAATAGAPAGNFTNADCRLGFTAIYQVSGS